MSAIHRLNLRALDGSELALNQFERKVLLIVNVASQCGFTPQYEGLQALQERYAEQGFSVLGVPCNQFGQQEPAEAQEIERFCKEHYAVSFPMTEKLLVNEPNRHPLYRLLAGEGAEFPGEISWNFEKFLLDGQGAVIARFTPRTTPDDSQLISAIENALADNI